jgi:hypothetical protein
MTRTVLSLLIGLLVASDARADWYYFVMKIECGKTTLRIIDYSAYDEEGEARSMEPGAIDVDNLSTWRTTEKDLNVPDKPLPHISICVIPSGKYRVVLTNAGGGWSAPYPVVNVQEISDPDRPRELIHDLKLDKSSEFKRYEIVFSPENASGKVIQESQDW